MLRGLSLALKFAVELAAFAAFAYWGTSVASGVAAVSLAVATPTVAIVLWGRFAAPQSRQRLARRKRIPFELCVFALAALALMSAGEEIVALVFLVIVAMSTAMLTGLDQWSA